MDGEASRTLLLDTHVWIWYVEGNAQEITTKLVDVIEPAVERGGLLVSVMSVWEVAMLEAAHRVRFASDVRAWAWRALRFPGVRLAALTPSIAVASTRLPGVLHRDPADRILIATARELSATLVTRDDRILGYGAQGFVDVLDATPGHAGGAAPTAL